MIHIDRNRTDERSRPIRPDEAWDKAAEKATQKAREEAGKHNADKKVYAHDQVKAALEELFHDKCAYCETDVTAGFDWDVEHFRPKGKVAKRPDHPGYYWLTYTWANLYPSCQHCNQNRKDKPSWDDPSPGGTAGKLDQFPLEDESTRVMAPDVDLKGEKRLLIDPCEDQPENHLRFAVDGVVVAVAGDRKGEASIKVFHLNRRRLRKRRMKAIAAAIFDLKAIRKLEAGGDPDAAREFRSHLERFLLADSSEYAAAARAVVRDPAVFGV